MKKQRIIALALAGLMTSALFVGCNKNGGTQGGKIDTSKVPDYLNETGYPITKEKVTISAMGKKDPGAPEWNDLEIFKKAEELTNVHYDFELAEAATYTEKKNLKLVSGQYPEVFFRQMEKADEETYGPQGIFVDMKDLIAKYAPNLTKRMEENPSFRAAATALNGSIYSAPYNQETSFLNPHLSFVGQNWLDNCGIKELPTTVDDFYNMLVKFKTMDANGNGDANDEIPISGLAWDQIEWFVEPAFTGTVTGMNYDVVDGKVVFAPATDGYKAYCEFLNKLWKENLIDHELLTHTQQQFQAKVKNGIVGVYNASPTLFDDATIKGADGKLINQVSLKPLTSATNSKPTVRKMETIYTGKAVITNKCKYPEAVVRWLDIFYATPEEGVEGLNGNTFFMGLEGKHWNYTDDTKTSYKFIDPIKSFTEINNSVSVNMEMPCYLSFYAYQLGNPKMEMKVKGVMENQNPYRKEGYPSNVRYTKEESDQATLIEADINNYVKSMTAKFMTGEEPITNFDKFVAKLNDMGLDKLTKIKTDAYDRWMVASK